MGEEAPQPRPLGLDRLSPRGISLLEAFIRYHADRLIEPFYEELITISDRDTAGARERIGALAASEHSRDRLTVCYIVGQLAVRDPEFAYPLWCQLMRDPDINIRQSASQTLAESLGVLELDPERVVEVVDAHFEGQRPQNTRPPEHLPPG